MAEQPELELWDWLQIGLKLGYCSELVCATHDGLENTDEENEDWEAGGDPCQPALRIWTNNEKKETPCSSTSATQ